MWRSEPELDNKPWTTYWEKDDFAGLDMSSVWTTSAYHSKHCTGRYQDTREDQSQGRPRANWRSVVSKDLQKMGFTWEEAEVAALDRHGWRRSVAQCVQLDTGWIKVKVKVNCKLHMSFRLTPRSMILNCYKSKFSENFAGFHRFWRQQQLNEWR